MVNRRYDLDRRGHDFLVRSLRDGRALSAALAPIVSSHPGEAYTFLPKGIEISELYKFDTPLREVDYPIDRSERFLAAVRSFNSIDNLVAHIADLAVKYPRSAIWAEDFLARPGDPAVVESGVRRAGVRTCYFDDTITYVVNSKALCGSNRGNRIVKEMRSMPIWNGAILSDVDIGIAECADLDPRIREQMLKKIIVIFSLAYRMDGFVFWSMRRD